MTKNTPKNRELYYFLKIDPKKILGQTNRLRIRRFESDDFSAYFSIASHPRTGLYDENFPLSEEKARQDFASSLETAPFSLEKWNEYAVELLEDRRIIGTICHYTHVKSNHLVSAIGFHFHPDVHGQGYAFEAVSVMRDLLFAHGVSIVAAIVDECNQPSINLLMKLGMIQTEINPLELVAVGTPLGTQN